jgi:uncharacterized membrane protein
MGCCGSSSNHNKKQTQMEMDHNLSPIDLLKIRLAKGEITFEEYEKTKAILQQ